MSNKGDQLINQLALLCAEDEWIYYQSSCFYISSEAKNWTESREYCLNREADMIIINNRQKQDFVRKITDKRGFWIGVTDIDVEGTWKWVDGSTLTSGIWASGEPNGEIRENCAVTYLTYLPELIGWIDVACDDAYQWICEKSILPHIQS
ncbi:CD209 antigen-like protein A [Garra rufa]|uniref:CD209 antigen-like protein A n=1 Tax=Garra rufa TaxID=137080 RepID=UPI003CCEA7B7